jgi:hypothetical protein
MVVKRGKAEGEGMCEFVVCLRGSVVTVDVLVLLSHHLLPQSPLPIQHCGNKLKYLSVCLVHRYSYVHVYHGPV